MAYVEAEYSEASEKMQRFQQEIQQSFDESEALLQTTGEAEPINMFRQRENLPSDPDLKQMINNIKKIESEVTLKSPNKENSIAKEYSAPRFVNAKLIDAKSLLPRLGIDQAPKKGALAEAFVWGSGKDGRCGNGRETSEKVPKKVKAAYTFTSLSCGYHHSAAVSQEGMALTWGRGVFG